MADWEEIKRLAADFQKIQLSSTAQRLSERNCIEIVTWLRERKIINLIFTVDGKEYLTPAQLIQDIRNELYDSGGRINLVELSRATRVDIVHINTYLNDILKGQRDIHFILGQLIDATYIARIAGEINEKLQQQGQINVGDLTIQYDLPAEFLQQHVLERNVGKLIHAKQDRNDPKVFFTESFVARSKAKIRGALNGLTRPTSVVAIINHIDISEKLFFSLFDQLVIYGSLTGRLAGAQYVPNVYARSQNEWVTDFYKQNNYLEYDALIRLGISDYKTYIKKQLKSEQITHLNSIAVSQRILERLEADIDECISSKTFLDLQNNLPSVFNDVDIKMILDTILSVGQKRQQTILIDNYVVSKAFLDDLSSTICDQFVMNQAKLAVESGSYQKYQTELQMSHNIKGHGGSSSKFDDGDEKVDKREERRKKASGGKSGGGAQGRETKTKSTKKVYRGGSNKHAAATGGDGEDDEYYEEDGIGSAKKITLDIVNFVDVKGLIQNRLESEGLDEIVDSIAKYLLKILNQKGLDIAAELYSVTIADRTANRRQTHNELQNKLNTLIGDVRLFEKGLKLLPADQQAQLTKYLLKSLCTDIVTELLNYAAAEHNSNTVTDTFTNEQRLKFVGDLPAAFRTPLLALVKSLSGQSVDDFMGAVEDSLSACSMIIKKIDKKKDRTVVLNHKYQLLEELNKCDDLALVLHLTILIVFTTATQCMLHVSGRYVAGVLTFLKQYLNEEQYLELTSYHDFVTLMLSGGSESENAKEKLKEKISIIKKIANEYKKPGVEKS